MNASEIAKIEDVNKKVEEFLLFAQTLIRIHENFPALLLLACDIINQDVTVNTIALANRWWKAFDRKEQSMLDIELPDIVKLIANHNPDYQPGEEAFALLDDMVKVGKDR